MSNVKIRKKTLLNLLFFTIILLTILWILQLFFSNLLFTSMKKSQLQRLTVDIVDKLEVPTFTENYDSYLTDVAYKNDITIMIFTMNDVTKNKGFANTSPLTALQLNIIYSQGRNPTFPNSELIDNFFEKLGSKQMVSYITKVNADKKFNVITFAAKKEVAQNNVYFYFNSSFMPSDGNSVVMQNQFVIITLICLLLAILLSYLMSRRISKPIEKLTLSAKELANGNLDVHFEARGFDEVNELAMTLNYATQELKKTDKLRKDLIANVSHELRTPLTIIKAYSEMIRDLSGENKEKREKHLNVILTESDRLTRLVNDILDLSRLESGSEPCECKAFNLSLCVNKVFVMFETIYKEKGYNFDILVENDILINGDERRVEQVIFNLIANAINYSGDTKFIGIKLISNKDNFIFTCQDKGKGIKEEDIPYVFDRFFRAEEKNRNSVGTGIGLSLVKQILTSHNFDFGVNSKVGEGSIFYFKGIKVIK